MGVHIASSIGNYPLHEAAISVKDEAVDILKVLFEAGANVDILSSSGLTPHEALKFGSKLQVQALLNAGANVEVKTEDGENCYELAKKNKTEEVLEVLRSERMNTSKIWRRNHILM